MVSVIELRGVHKTYDMEDVKVEVLKGIDFSISEGEFVAIVGASGSGKSTLLHIMGLLDRPSRGKVLVEGRDASSIDDNALSDTRGRKIGFVFQFFNLYPTLNARENIELPLLIQGVPAATRAAKARKLLGMVGLSEKESNMPSQLSGGQRQRVSIARALVTDPEIVLADEPTGNLDSKTGQEVVDMLVKINRQTKKTVVIITHDEHVASHADRIIVIKDGLVISDRKNSRRSAKK